MGTTYGGLYLPSVSEVGWTDLVNANFTTIADWHLTARSIVLPATQGVSSAGAAPTNVGGAFPAGISGFTLTNGVTSGAYWTYMIPLDADGVNGTTFRPIWAPSASDAGTNAIRWSRGLTGVTALSGNGGSIIAANSSTVAWTGDAAARTANIAVAETGSLHDFPASGGIWMRFSISRLGADALDTFTQNAVLLGVRIDYTGV